MSDKKLKVKVVVLGDVGRSPRMQYHALSLANEGYSVDVVGYGGSEPIQELSCHRNVNFSFMRVPPEFKAYFPTILAYFLKVVWQSVSLLFALILSGSCDYLLLQNPPAIPSLIVCYIFSFIFRCKFVIDWHNYAHSIMALSIGKQHSLVKFSRHIEYFFGRRSHRNICVTKSMKEDLATKHGIEAVVLYDRPPTCFKKISLQEKHELFLRLGQEYPLFLKGCKENETIFTCLNENGMVILKNNAPGIVISSTSWTEDEDFSILLAALEEYENYCEESDEMPQLICIITGKGPLKEFYCNIIERREWSSVQVITPWLSPQDYPLVLASADLGVSLHTSSSGFDLPMKVVDMFGCGVPVCAYYFNCIYELVKHEDNSLIFHDSEELAKQMISWFKGFPTVANKDHSRFRKELERFGNHRWEENWKLNAWQLFK